MSTTTVQFVLAGAFASLFLYVPSIIGYHVLTDNGRKHTVLRHRAAGRVVGMHRRGTTGPLTVTPVPYRYIAWVCTSLGFIMVALYVW